jgi:hypothetical protein
VTILTQVYKIKETKHEIYERGETCVFDIEIRLLSSGAMSNVSDITITLTNPCGDILLNAQSMTSDSTGSYVYNYTLPSDSIYGEYTILYEATAYVTGTVSSKMSNMFVFRDDLVNKIRRYAQIGKETIDDEDLSGMAMDALREALDEVFEFHKDEVPVCDPNYGVLFNGTNTIVRTSKGNIADHNYDGSVLGTSASSCVSDITGYWIDSAYAKHTAKITINDAVTGRITITQTDDSAIPASYKGIYISYWTEWESYNEQIFEDAVAYLAAHHVILGMTEAHKATAADLPSNQKKIELNLQRFKTKYKELMSKISRPLCDGL